MSYIVNFNPVVIDNIDVNYYIEIEKKIKKKESISSQEVNNLLNAVIYLVRFKINPNLDNFDNKCDLAVSMLYYYFKDLGCEVFSSMTQNVITNDIVGHSFLTVQILVDGKVQNYLLDPTYIQFFKNEKCSQNNYYVSPLYKDVILLTPDPGFFIEKKYINTAKSLLDHGYMLLTEENAEMYGNSFYNTKTGGSYSKNSYQTIPGDVYINSFIHGKEPVSKSKDELIQNNLHIEPFYQLEYAIKQR